MADFLSRFAFVSIVVGVVVFLLVLRGISWAFTKFMDFVAAEE